MKLTVIVPVYNAQKYLKECVYSILNQVFKDFELILVDDGSKDNSGLICDELANQDSRISVIHKDNSGVSAARYEGLLKAKGEYIAFVDNDDLLMPNLYKRLFELKEKDVDIVSCSRIDVIIDSNSDKVYKSIQELNNSNKVIITTLKGNEACQDLIKENKYYIGTPLWGRIYKRNYLIDLHFEKYSGIIPTIYFEDIFAMPYILLNAKKVRFTNEILYVHREITTSISRSGKLSSFFYEQSDSYKFVIKLYKQNKLNLLYAHYLKVYFNILIRNWYYSLKKSNNLSNKSFNLKKNKCYIQEYKKEFDKYLSRADKLLLFCIEKFPSLFINIFAMFYFEIISNKRRKKYFRSIKRI